MQVTTATSHTRSYSVDDDGDAVQLHLVDAGQQVGGAFFPFDQGGEDSAFDLANMMGASFVASARPRSAGLS
jgi:hypothetical protein